MIDPNLLLVCVYSGVIVIIFCPAADVCMWGSQSATGVYLSALPTPGGIQIAGKASGDLSNEQHVLSIQKRINDAMAKNKEMYHINPPVSHTHTCQDTMAAQYVIAFKPPILFSVFIDLQVYEDI